MKHYRTLALASLLCLVSCARPKPVQPPPPPSISVQQKSYPKPAPPRPGDMVIKNCTVTHEEENKADCICRRGSTKIDVNDPGKQVVVCR